LLLRFLLFPSPARLMQVLHQSYIASVFATGIAETLAPRASLFRTQSEIKGTAIQEAHKLSS
jgi:hypothetical protein